MSIPKDEFERKAKYWSSRALRSVRPLVNGEGVGRAEAYRLLASRDKSETELRTYAVELQRKAASVFEADGVEWARLLKAISDTILKELAAMTDDGINPVDDLSP